MTYILYKYLVWEIHRLMYSLLDVFIAWCIHRLSNNLSTLSTKLIFWVVRNQLFWEISRWNGFLVKFKSHDVFIAWCIHRLRKSKSKSSLFDVTLLHWYQFLFALELSFSQLSSERKRVEENRKKRLFPHCTKYEDVHHFFGCIRARDQRETWFSAL